MHAEYGFVALNKLVCFLSSSFLDLLDFWTLFLTYARMQPALISTLGLEISSMHARNTQELLGCLGMVSWLAQGRTPARPQGREV